MQQLDPDTFAQEMAGRCLGTRVGRLHRLITRSYEQALASAGVSMPQLELLATLTLVGDPIRPTELARILAVERSTISRNLGLLEQRGWVDVTERSATGRTMAVQITDAGRDQLARSRDAWEAAQAAAEATLGASAPRDLDAWLTALDEAS